MRHAIDDKSHIESGRAADGVRVTRRRVLNQLSGSALGSVFGSALGPLLMLPSGRALAQDSRASVIVVPFAPGGSGDITARLVSQHLTEKTGAAVAVENKPGANGIIGVEAAKAAAPDGRTLLLATTSTHAANPSLYKKLPYDPERDFQVVGVFGTGGSYLVVNPQAPYKTLAEFIAYAKGRPGQLNYGHFNASSQVPGALIKAIGGIDLTAVSYKTIGAAMNDLAGGVLHAIFVDTAAGDAYVSSGRLRAIAITRAKRWSRYPDLPAMAEVWPEFVMSGFLGMAVPAGTPRAVMETLNGHINDAITSEPMKSKLESFGFTPQRMSLEECAEHVRGERRRWANYVKVAGIEPQ